MKNLRELMLEEMADVYNAEKQLAIALPKMAKSASSDELQQAFEEHIEQTQEQITRLEKAFKSLGSSVKSKKCEAMQGLVAEGKRILEENAGEAVLDAGLIAAAQKVEHYEIATYGCLATWASLLGEEEAHELFKQTLAEEKETDERLTEIAEGMVNVEAAEGEAEVEKAPARSSRGGSTSRRGAVGSRR